MDKTKQPAERSGVSVSMDGGQVTQEDAFSALVQTLRFFSGAFYPTDTFLTDTGGRTKDEINAPIALGAFRDK